MKGYWRRISYLCVLALIAATVFAVGAEAADVTTYADLQEIFQKGGDAKLTGTIAWGNETYPLTVALGKTVTLDLNGFTIDKNGKNSSTGTS